MTAKTSLVSEQVRVTQDQFFCSKYVLSAQSVSTAVIDRLELVVTNMSGYFRPWAAG